MAQAGYALNRMCYSFNSADNRAEFKRDEDAYCRKYGLDDAQRTAIAHRNVQELIAAGGNIYFLAKFAGILGLDVQDIGAQQTGMTKEAFKAMLVEQGR
jgi:protocatechuate 4,5-dioxygenase alpha chain